jgi:ribosomal protein S19E (S16A)
MMAIPHMTLWVRWAKKGEQVATSICDQLETDGVVTQSTLTLSSDGRNVNKTIFRAVNKKIKESGNPGYINIVTCNLHVVHLEEEI